MEGIYKINLIPNDLSVEETILQIADTLDNLNGIVDDVFTRVTSRIQRNMDKTTKLQERIDVSRLKIEKLAGMQKAIKLFSSAKYPAAIVHEHYQSIFDTNEYKYEPKKVTLSGKSQRPSNDKAIQEKLHFFHVKVADPKTSHFKQDFDIMDVVNKVSTVGDLLIYNTDESPYQTIPSIAQAYVPKVATTSETNQLEDAPPSIMNKNLLKREIDEYMYAPGMGMVPELDMPLDLPHLPGIAGDVQYLISDDGSIAPSAVTSPVVPITNTILASEIPELPDLKELPEVKVEEVPDIPDAPPAAPAPPPPPPPPPVIPSPPPPPPPPPPMDFETPKQTKREERNKDVPTSSGSGDAHASLMAAIRQAGGVGRAKLRPAAESTPAKGAKEIGGDLMADLHAKLSMRRRGISGAERSGGSVLHTLASIIPEPGESSPPRSSSDEDWE